VLKLPQLGKKEHDINVNDIDEVNIEMSHDWWVYRQVEIKSVKKIFQ
jgi:hypothetical protein